jgi:hypothetical protein
MQPAAISLPVPVTARPSARPRGIVPAAAVPAVRPARHPALPLRLPAAPPVLPAEEIDPAFASPLAARATAAYRAAAASGAPPRRGALGIDLLL